MTSAALSQLIASVASVTFVALVGYIAAKVRGVSRYLKQHAADHEWLMEQVAINTEAIATMLGTRPAPRRPPRPRERGSHGR